MKLPLFALGLALHVAQTGAPADANQSRQGVLARYDTNRDGRLDATERAQARTHLERRPTAFGRSVAPVDSNPSARRARLMERYDLDRSGALSHHEATLARESFASARVHGTRTETDPLRASLPSAAPSNPFGFPDWPAETTAPVASEVRDATTLGVGSTTSPIPPSGRAPSGVASSGLGSTGLASSGSASSARSQPTRSATRPSAPTSGAPSARSTPRPSTTVAPPKPDPFYNQPVPSGKGGGKAGGGKAGGKGKAGAGGAKPGGAGGRRAGGGPIF